MEALQLLAVKSGSSAAVIGFEILGRGEGIRVKIPRRDWISFPGPDLFRCLLEARLELESEGLMLCCQGARPDVFPSGMQQQMDNGRFASVLSGPSAERQVVDIFQPADPSEVDSVEAQRVAVFRYFKLPVPDVKDGPLYQP